MSDLAGKYRPKSLDDIVGQEVVVRTLTNALKAGNLHHAYLFVGQFGSGKTTAARLLAAMENCENTPGLSPCGKCGVCKGVFDGTHTDVIEVDAASGAGKVDQIRELKKEAQYNPVDGAKKKYFIIDECHRMTPESNDALLKLIEEPPAHCRFILCTTDVQKVKPTVLSRCQRHDFHKIYWSKMGDQLEKIAAKEKLDAERAALNLCAQNSDGSMRTALQHLEKLMSYAGGPKITLDDARSMFGSVSASMFFDLFDQIIGDDAGRADSTKGFRIINSMLSVGADFTSIYSNIADHLRNLMVGLTSADAHEFIHLSEEGKKRLKDQLKRISQRGGIEAVLDSLSKLDRAVVSVEHNISPETALQHWFLKSVFAIRKPR